MSENNAHEMGACVCGQAVDSGCGEPLAADSGCCAPSSGPARRVKTLVFLLVMGAAVVVLAHGLVKKSRESVAKPDRAFGASTLQAAAHDDGTPGVCGPTLESLASLSATAGDKDAVFLLLPGEDDGSAQTVSSQVQAVADRIRSKGKRVEAFTLEKNAADRARLVEQHSITSFPCVVVMASSGASRAVWGEITETKLIQAFVEASAPPSSCGTSCDSSCTCSCGSASCP